MARIALALLVACIPPAALAQTSEKAQPIHGVLGKVNRMLAKMRENDPPVRTTLAEAKVFAEPVSAKVDVRTVEPLDGGGLLVIGSIKVSRGGEDRYRTEDERREISKRSEALRAVRDRDRLRSQASKDSWTRDPGIAAMEKDLLDYRARTRADADRRKEQAESVEIRVMLDPALRATIDPDDLVMGKRLSFQGLVVDYKCQHDPEEIGGDLYMSLVKIQCGSAAQPVGAPTEACDQPEDAS